MYSPTFVILATFNGAEFLAEQLDSLIAQYEPNLTLLIRDDGSTDRTLEIAHNYSKKDNRIQILANDRGGSGCAQSNFSTLLETAYVQGADYIF